MKKWISILFVLAMMLSLAVAGTVGTSAYSDIDHSKYYGCYATTAPTVDGEIDEIWSTTIPMYFTNNTWGYVKMLWREDAVYLLADITGTTANYVDFFVTTKGYNKNWAYSWSGENGCHYVRCQKNADSSSADYTLSEIWYLSTTTKTPDATVKAIPKADNNGFVAEVKIPFGANDATMQIDSTIGFGAQVNGDMWLSQSVGLKDLNGDNGFVSELTHDTTGRNAYIFYAMKLHSAPEHFIQSVPATCTEPEQRSYGCSECKMQLQTVSSGSTSLDPDNHSGDEVFADNGDGTHSKKWDCCDAVISTESHTYGEMTVDKQPTCTESGSGSETCTVCNSKHVLDDLPSLGGHIAGDWKTLTEATCSKKGEEYCTCTRCWETIEIREIAMLAHSATDWIIDKEAAPGVEGKRHQQCKVCGALFNEEVIAALPVEKGCGAVVSASALGVSATVVLAVGTVWKRKKKED